MAAVGTATPASGTATACVALTPELTEGPYYLDDQVVRGDIVEDREGVPLNLTIGVIDTETCAPLANAAVEIWHCDARGYYSGVSGNNPGSDSSTDEQAAEADATWLRGVQLTDDNGQVTFQTIFPGWYVSRAIHIHMKVHVDGDVDSANTYEGGHVSHTGQLFFAEDITEAVMATDYYANRPDQERTLNEDNNILGDHIDDSEFMVAMTQIDSGDLSKGYNGTVTVGVDPSVIQTGAGGPGAPRRSWPTRKRRNRCEADAGDLIRCPARCILFRSRRGVANAATPHRAAAIRRPRWSRSCGTVGPSNLPVVLPASCECATGIGHAELRHHALWGYRPADTAVL